MKTFIRDAVSGALRRVTWEDPGAAHQIRVTVSGSPARIAISCTCLGRTNEPHAPLGARDVFADGEALAIWRAHIGALEHTA